MQVSKQAKSSFLSKNHSFVVYTQLSVRTYKSDNNTLQLGDYPGDIPLIQYDNGPLEPVYWETELTNSLSVNLKIRVNKKLDCYQT